MRDFFHTRLEEFKEEFIHMGSLVESQFALSLEALKHRDTKAAYVVKEKEAEVNAMYDSLERGALELFIRYSPVARDLQLIASILKIISDLERIGDHAEDISDLVIMSNGHEFPPEVEQLNEMGEYAKAMLAKSLDAFVLENKQLAEETYEMEKNINRMHQEVVNCFYEVLKDSKEEVETTIYLTQIAKYFEKVGDHSENIAERVYPKEV